MKYFFFTKPLMRMLLAAALAVSGTTYAAPNSQAPAKKTDAEVRQLLIEASIDAYPGNCPCPYNTMRNGRACGGRSAWNRPGGYAPLCYPKDVSDEQVAQWREDNE